MIASYQLSLGTSCCVFEPSLSIVEAVYMSTCMILLINAIRTAVIVIITPRKEAMSMTYKKLVRVDHGAQPIYPEGLKRPRPVLVAWSRRSKVTVIYI